VQKSTSLTEKVNELEQQNGVMKTEMFNTKQTLGEITREMEQRKKDHADQLSHLQEELLKWEKQSMTQAGTKFIFQS
jgi:hypothetical protein